MTSAQEEKKIYSGIDRCMRCIRGSMSPSHGLQSNLSKINITDRDNKVERDRA